MPNGAKPKLMDNHSLSHEDLFESFKKGDQNAFAQLFELFHSGLVLLADSLQPDEDLSEKIANTSLAEAWEKRKSFRSWDHLTTDLRKITEKACTPRRNSLSIKKKTAKEKEEFPEFFQNHSAEENLIDILLENMIGQMGPMSVRTRRIFHLSCFEGKSYAEIATELDMTKQAVTARMNRVLKSFREGPETDPFFL
jgi:DNA-directed RNA polymerase specialized sigma24 family protein